MYEIIYTLMTKIDSLAGSAVAEYMLEQQLYGNLHMTWFWISAFVGFVSLASIIVGTQFMKDRKWKSSGQNLAIAGGVVLFFAVIATTAFYSYSQINIIHSKTAVLQLLKIVF